MKRFAAGVGAGVALAVCVGTGVQLATGARTVMPKPTAIYITNDDKTGRYEVRGDATPGRRALHSYDANIFTNANGRYVFRVDICYQGQPCAKGR